MRRSWSEKLARSLLPAILLLSAVFFWRVSAGAAAGLRGFEALHSFRDVQKSGEDYASMLLAEARSDIPAAFAFSAELTAQTIRDPLTQRTAQVTPVAIKGDARLVLPIAQPLAADDHTGCLIDRKSAEALYGTRSAVGNTLVCNDKEYTVRGVFEGPQGTLLFLGDGETEYGYISVRTGAPDAFALRHGLGGSVSGAFYADMAHVLSRLPVLCALLLALLFLHRQRRRHALFPLRATLLLICCFAVLTALLLYLLFTVPLAYVPSRWSDFAQYSSIVGSIGSSLQSAFALRKTRADLYVGSLFASSLTGGLSTLLALAAYLFARLSCADDKAEAARPREEAPAKQAPLAQSPIA